MTRPPLVRSVTGALASRGGIAAVAGLAGLTIGIAGVAVASIPDANGVIHGCYLKKTGALRVIDTTKRHCTRDENRIRWNARGPQGPSGVVAIMNFNPGETDINPLATPAFAGTPATVTVTNRRTTALVTGTLDFGSTDGTVLANLSVCYQHGSEDPVVAGRVQPDFTGDAGAYYAQSISGAVGNVGAGTYKVGICTDSESANVLHGFGYGTVLVVQGPAPITYPQVGPFSSVRETHRQQ